MNVLGIRCPRCGEGYAWQSGDFDYWGGYSFTLHCIGCGHQSPKTSPRSSPIQAVREAMKAYKEKLSATAD